MLKIISVSLLSLGLATSVMAQSPGTGAGSNSDNKVNPGAMHAPQKTDDTVTNSTGTNCAPNMQTSKTKSITDKTGDASTTAGKAGVNTDGQSSSC